RHQLLRHLPSRDDLLPRDGAEVELRILRLPPRELHDLARQPLHAIVAVDDLDPIAVGERGPASAAAAVQQDAPAEGAMLEDLPLDVEQVAGVRLEADPEDDLDQR